jgi:hypothetical protein
VGQRPRHLPREMALYPTAACLRVVRVDVL